MLAQDSPVSVFDHGGKLMQVTDQQQLHATKGKIAATVTTQHGVYAIKQVGADHTYLIDDQQIKAFDDIYFILIELVPGRGFTARHEGTEWHLKKGMQGHATRINGGNTGGCCDDHPFRTLLFDIVQKGRFSSAGLSRQVNIAARVPDKFIGELQFRVCGVHHFALGKSSARVALITAISSLPN